MLGAWLLGCVVMTRPLEQSLQRAAADCLSQSEFQHAFDQVSVSFAGQEATLTGKVLDQASKDLAEKVVLQEVRLKDQYESHNPVTRVHNRLEIDDSTLPRPWLIVTFFEGKIRVDGVLGDASQKLALLDSLAVQAPTALRNDQCVIEPKTVACKNWTSTLAALPNFVQLTAGKTGIAARLAACTSGDGAWQTFPHNVSNAEVVASLANAKVSESLVEFSLNALRTAPVPKDPNSLPQPK